MSDTEGEDDSSDGMDDEVEEQFYLLLSAAKSAYEVAEEGKHAA